MKFIFGKKIQMSQIFTEDGTLVPVTVVKVFPCVVTQIKQQPHDVTTSVQVGFEEAKVKHLSKPQLGHLKNLSNVRELREVAMEEKELEGIERGDIIEVATFSAGDMVDVVGTSKGRGFQGVVKRHHFKGGPASHGHKDNLRMPGSIGAGGVQRVFKGMRMGGHMGDAQITIKNLSIVNVDSEKNIIQIKGAVPGGRNGLVFIKGHGVLKILKASRKEPVEVEKVVEVKAEPVPESTASAT